ncbi:MAG: FHA domain-containing protein [Acidobacteriota bacterium]
MNSTQWNSSDADEHGFVAFDLIREKAALQTREQFVAELPVPALMVLFGGAGSAGGEALDIGDSGIQLMTVSIKSTAILRYLGKLAFISKRPGNPFAHLISIGRSVSNDITLAVESVSKVHGYFVRDAGGWAFTDHGSTNGTFLNGNELTTGEKYRLFDGSVLRLGLEATIEYLSPEALYDRALKE